MNAIGVIPARLASTRLAKKALVDICGKPMLQYVWEAAKKATLLDEVIIAADDDAVMEAASRFGAKAVLTSTGHRSGTDRITEAIDQIDAQVIINIQADEPLVQPVMINQLADVMLSDKGIVMATLAKRITNKEDAHNPNIVKVVFDKEGFALYFSRAPIPYTRETQDGGFLTQSHYKHIGIYAYTKDFIFTYTNMPQSKLEAIEKLEQLRALENGYKIKIVQTDCETVSVDTEADLQKVRKLLGAQAKND